MSNSSIWPINRTLSAATTPGKTGHGDYANKAVLLIPQRSSIPGTSLLEYEVSNQDINFEGLEGLTSSVEKQSVHFTATAD